ncbi:MAG: class I SAM-dependent methyltransferase [Myxococcales bacterium]|nr:class I SAM-dependent methyltransferase [Myxococcales bacterium]USN51333.1 MAG: class I SAM-dependent methyltransferase [Myxococcales bacterium]
MNEALSPYVRLIGKIANTRHPGGLKASESLLNKTDINKKWRILDLGCGAGHTSAHIAKKYGCYVNGVDISTDALHHASQLYKNEPYFKQMQFEQGDIKHLSFSDGYFNAVVCESVLLFLEEKEAAIAEMIRVLKPGGFLLLNELCLGDSSQDELRSYLARPEFAGHLCSTHFLEEIILKHGLCIKINEQNPLNILEQLKADILQFGNMKGVYQLLELAHQIFTNRESRIDILRLIKFFLDMPSGISKLINLRILAQKSHL